MKTSLEWLGDFLQQPPTAQAAADAPTSAGFPTESIEAHGSDLVLDVEVTSNRGDCLSHVGIARELSAFLKLPFHQKPAAAKQSGGHDNVLVRIDEPNLCPHYTDRLIRGVKVGPSPAWMTRRLEAVGIRPINNIVDVTNYVMMELGH